MLLKPIVKTLLLSSIVFTVLVFLGVKYQWIAFFKPIEDIGKVELTLPQASLPMTTLENSHSREPPFQLEIIQSNKQPITANLSKQQILEGCLQLYNKLGVVNESMIDVISGDCVVSNYQETIQDANNHQRTNEYIQKKLLIERRCYKQVENQIKLNPLEKQLLWGVCVSDHLNR